MTSKEKGASKIVSGIVTITRRRSAALALMLLLTACESPSQLRQKSPDLDEMTNAVPERLAGCIGDKFEGSPGSFNTRFSTRPTTNGYSISGDQAAPGLYSFGGTDTIILVDIAKLGDKTHVQVWSHNLIGTSPFIAVVRACL